MNSLKNVFQLRKHELRDYGYIYRISHTPSICCFFSSSKIRVGKLCFKKVSISTRVLKVLELSLGKVVWSLARDALEQSRSSRNIFGWMGEWTDVK